MINLSITVADELRVGEVVMPYDYSRRLHLIAVRFDKDGCLYCVDTFCEQYYDLDKLTTFINKNVANGVTAFYLNWRDYGREQTFQHIRKIVDNDSNQIILSSESNGIDILKQGFKD